MVKPHDPVRIPQVEKDSTTPAGTGTGAHPP